MKASVTFLLICLFTASIFAQNNMDDYTISEAKRYKTGGVAMLIGGVGAIGFGAAMISNESQNSKVMGAVLASAGVALDVGGILNIRKGRQMLDSARKTALYISPNGLQFAVRF